MKVKTCEDKWDPSGAREVASSYGNVVDLYTWVQTNGERERGEVFADRVDIGGEESLIRRTIRARMRGEVCRTAPRLFGLGVEAAGSPGVKLGGTEIKVLRSSFTVKGTSINQRGDLWKSVNVLGCPGHRSLAD